jgi:hypothetical protein
MPPQKRFGRSFKSYILDDKAEQEWGEVVPYAETIDADLLSFRRLEPERHTAKQTIPKRPSACWTVTYELSSEHPRLLSTFFAGARSS